MGKKKVIQEINRLTKNIHNKTPLQRTRLIKTLTNIESQVYKKLKMLRAFNKMIKENK